MTVAKTLRKIAKALTTLVEVWSSRDHHLKVTYFKSRQLNHEYYSVIALALSHYRILLKTNQRHLETVADIHRLRISFEFSSPSPVNFSNRKILSQAGGGVF